MKKLKVYFAHPSTTKDSDEEKCIMVILRERGLEVINPFDEEAELRNQYDWKTWTKTIPRNIAEALWTQDLAFIRKMDGLVAWFPTYKAIGTAAEVQYALDLQKKYFYTRKNFSKIFFIQIISEIRHPLFAYAIKHGNQLYDNINDFKRFTESDW